MVFCFCWGGGALKLENKYKNLSYCSSRVPVGTGVNQSLNTKNYIDKKQNLAFITL